MLANKSKELDQSQKEYLAKAIEGSERLLGIINDTLDISRIEQNSVKYALETFDLKSFIEKFIEDFKVKTKEKSLYLKLYPSKEKIVVTADKSKLTDILMNLMGNSLKFTHSGGISVYIEDLNNKYVRVKITDSGIGIPRQDLDRLFNKFGRLDNSYTTVASISGSGLGLYIVKSLIQKFGGQVGAYSDGIGTGSTFWFTLPIQKDGASVDKVTSLL